MSFWDFMERSGPGLLDLGTSIYGMNAGNRQQDAQRGRVQGPLYQGQMAGAQKSIDQAGNFDPKAHAAERFAAQQAIKKPSEDAGYLALMRSLHAKGMLGVSSNDPGVAAKYGVSTDNGPINPQMAAFFAAQNAQRSKDAYDSLGQGDAYLQQLIKNAGMLQGQASATQQTGLTGEGLQRDRAGQTMGIIKSVSDLLKKPGADGTSVIGDIFKTGGLLNTGVTAGTDWLKSMFGSPATDSYTNLNVPSYGADSGGYDMGGMPAYDPSTNYSPSYAYDDSYDY